MCQFGGIFKTPLVSGPGDTPEAARLIAASEGDYPKLLKLDKDTKVLDTDALAASARLSKLSSRMKYLGGRLQLPGDVHTVLADVIAQLEAARTGARIAVNFEATKASAQGFLDASGPALNNLKAADQKLVGIVRFTQPLSQDAKRLALYSSLTSDALKKFSDDALSHEPDITYCVRYSLVYSSASRAQNACIKQKAEAAAVDADVAALGADKAINPLLTSFSPDLPPLRALNGFDPGLAPMEKLLGDAKKLRSALKPLCDQLKRLNGDIDIPLGVYTIKVPIGKILDTSLDLEDYIKRKVSDVVWDAAKVFGIDKLLHKLMDAADSVMSDVARHVNFNIGLSLPLDAIDGLAPKVPALSAAFPGDLPIPKVGPARSPLLAVLALTNFPGKDVLDKLKGQLTAAAPFCVSGNHASLKLFPPTFGCRK